MAIAFDAASVGTSTTSTTQTWSHTCTGDNRILFVAGGIPTNDTITGVTYAGVAMTKISGLQNGRWNYLWYLIAPATGANNIVVTTSASDILRSVAASYTGVKQSGVPDATAEGNYSTGANADATQSVTTVADNCWIVAMGSGVQIGAGASTTQRAEVAEDGTGIFDTNLALTPAGSHDIKVKNTDSVTRTLSIIAASFAPFVEGGAILDLTSKMW
jgi:hypothetical protein